MVKMKRFFWGLILLMICAVSNATHHRGGQILFRHISGYTYEFTITMFYYTPIFAAPQRVESSITVSWGDNTTSIILSETVEQLPDNYFKTIYRTRHTFPGSGVYTVLMEEYGRNPNIMNISTTNSVSFSVKAILRIDPNNGPNNSPLFLTDTFDKAAVGRRFVHNLSAYDIDGDSLSYELAVCTGAGGMEIEAFTLPETSNELYVDGITGDFVWDAPVKTGVYNIAIRVIEWRHGVKISSTVRDMQIEVVDSDNNPPVVPAFRDTCVVAGTFLSIPVHATDADGDEIILTATGGPFEMSYNKAIFTVGNSSPGSVNASFTWQTDLTHIRKQPYTVVFRAEDQNDEVKLVSFANYNIYLGGCKLPTSNIDEINIAPLARIYPNPTDGMVTLEFESEGVYHLALADMSGRTLLRNTVTGQSAQIDIGNYPAGVYLLTIDDAKRQYTMRIVKN